MKSHMSSLYIFLLLLVLSQIATATVTERARRLGWDEDAGYVSTREEVLARRVRDRQRLEEKLEQFQLDLDRHELGLKAVPNPVRLKSKIESYQKKIRKLSTDMDEFDVQRVLWREDVLAEVARHRRSLRSEL